MRWFTIIALPALVAAFVPSSPPQSGKYCVNCKHFNTDSLGILPLDDVTSRWTSCRLFQHVDLVTGRVKPTPAREIRSDPTKCGPEGVFYVPKLGFKENKNGTGTR